MKTFNSVVCLKCGHSFIAQKDVFAEIKHDQIYVADNIGFAGSQITCSNCSEVHEYMADKEILTLQLVTIPVNHKGSPSKIFYPNDSQETVDQHINIELLEAVKTGAFNKMKSLIENGVSTNTIDDEGNPILWHAVENGDLNIVKCLVENGAIVDKKHSSGQLALDRAAQNGHLEIVKYLADHDSPLNDTLYSLTPLHLAAQECHLDVVKYLVDEKQFEINNDSPLGTPLHLAATSGCVDVVRFLVEKGADTFKRTNLGNQSPIEKAKDLLKMIDEEDLNIAEDDRKNIEKVIKYLNGEIELDENEEAKAEKNEANIIQKKWWKFWK